MASSPGKTRARWGRTRRVLASVSKAERARQRSLELVRNGAAKANQQMCPFCQQMLYKHEWDPHIDKHMLAQEERRKRPTPPPNPDKERERRRRGDGRMPTPSRKQPKKGPGPEPDPDSSAAAWKERIKQTEDFMAGKGGTPGPMDASSANLARAFQAWASEVPSKRKEIEAHLMGMTAAIGIGAQSVRDWTDQAIIGQRLHPAIARPLESAATSMEEDRMDFTRAYQILLRIYRNRIEHEEQEGPKPDEQFWKD